MLLELCRIHLLFGSFQRPRPVGIVGRPGDILLLAGGRMCRRACGVRCGSPSGHLAACCAAVPLSVLVRGVEVESFVWDVAGVGAAGVG
jgi:hypothetical protein